MHAMDACGLRAPSCTLHQAAPGMPAWLAARGAGRNGMADVAASKAEGRLRLDMPKPDTIADGLAGRMGDLTWPVVRDLVDAVVTVRARGAGARRGAGWGGVGLKVFACAELGCYGADI